MSIESGNRFESPQPRAPENPEKQLRSSLRGEAMNIIRSAENPLAVEIAEKMLQKINVKDKIDSMNLHRDDTSTYQTWKQLGLFIVIDTTSKINWQDKATGFKIKKGDSILDIHLPPVKPEQRTLTSITASLQLIAEYIAKQQLNPRYIMGVTFEKLALVSIRQGFIVLEPELPDDIKKGVERVYSRFSDRGINNQLLGRILLCYQPKNQFLQKYLKTSPIQ